MDGFKGKKILITGGLGFIGSNLAHSLKGEGAEVTILDNFDHESGSNSFNISNIESDIEILKEDIINYDTVLGAVKGKDIVFNADASTSHSISMKKPWENLRTNTLGVLNILESIKTLEPNISFVHIGTTTQIGPMRSSPSDELHPEFPTDMYSANKVVGEKYTLLYAKAYGLRCCVVRLPNVYGPRAAIHSPNITFNNSNLLNNNKGVLKSIVGNSEVKETDCNLCPRFSIEDCACGGTGIEQELIQASHNHFVRCHPRLLMDN